MKKRLMHLIAGVTMFVLLLSVCTTTTNAAVIWSDDFEGGLGDWTIFAYEDEYSLVTIEGNFTDAEGTLKVLDDDMNFARHSSTVNVGTWSFDMFVPDNELSGYAMYVYFMSNGSRQIPTFANYFVGVGVWAHPAPSFIVWTMNGLISNVESTINIDPIQGWHHIDVSRTSDGNFYVFVNGTFEANFTSNAVTSSTYLEFYCYRATGAAIDNLVVDDTVKMPSTPLSWELIIIGSVVTVVVIALTIVFLRRR
ncbi:MAG: hypothetical protein ACFFFO_14360 [Candidatus Thorarchaeota archaeon]